MRRLLSLLERCQANGSPIELPNLPLEAEALTPSVGQRRRYGQLQGTPFVLARIGTNMQQFFG